jgi:hypothetical protein
MICILADPGVGGTFLTWSLHFLAGHNNYFSVQSNSNIPLTTTPLTKLNAHNFKPNQPTTIDKLNQCLESLSNNKTENFHTLYFHNLDDCTRSTTSPTASAIDTVKNISSKIIYLSLDKKNSFYQWTYEGRVLNLNKKTGKKYQNFHEQHDGWVDEYFFKDKQQWKELGLTNRWDTREFLALNINPRDFMKMTDVGDFDFEHFYIDSFDLYHNFKHLIDDIFAYIDVKLDSNRKSAWFEIYQEWQQLHKIRVQFVYYFDTIIDYILKGNYFDLKRLNLDIVQEAIIQHEIIYKHNLNFKTWQLEQFDNTQQLHSLLETNIHTSI